MNSLLICGIFLFTAGLTISPFLVKEKYGVWFKNDPLLDYSVFIWLFYLGLLMSRWKFGRGGRRFRLEHRRQFCLYFAHVLGISPAVPRSIVHERCRHRPEPSYVARGIAGTVRLCRIENPSRACGNARLGRRVGRRHPFHVQSGRNLRGHGTPAGEGIFRADGISRPLRRRRTFAPAPKPFIRWPNRTA